LISEKLLFPIDHFLEGCMDEEKERQKEIREKLESEGIDPEELDEDEQEELADLL